MSKSASLAAEITRVTTEDSEERKASSWIESAEREALAMLATHGVMFDHYDAEAVNDIQLTLVRIINGTREADDIAAADRRVDAALDAHFKRTKSNDLSSDIDTQRLGFQRAAFYLGLAMGQILGRRS